MAACAVSPSGEEGCRIAPSDESTEKEEGIVLGFELRLDRLTVVALDLDNGLACLFCDHVVFDKDCPEWKTRRGVYTSTTSSFEEPDSWTPVDLLVKALDILLDRCFKSPCLDLERVRAIGCSGPSHMPVFLGSDAPSLLQALVPSLPLQVQLGSSGFFALPLSPNSDNHNTSFELRALQSRLAAAAKSSRVASEQFPFSNHAEQPEMQTDRAWVHAARTLGARPHLASFATHVTKVRMGRLHGIAGPAGEHAAQQAWERTSFVTSAGGLLRALLAGQIPSMNYTEAATTCLYNPALRVWDPDMLHIVSGGQPERLALMLGHIETGIPGECSDGGVTRASDWLTKRFGFSAECIVADNLPDCAAGYISFLPENTDACISFGQSDQLVVPTRHFVPSPSWALIPSPLQAIRPHTSPEPTRDDPPWLAISHYQDAAHARAIVRDIYTNSRWSVFNQLVKIIPPGGGVGLDNKLFTFFRPTGPTKGLRRFETGVRVAEYADLRANARCLLEGQALAMRVALGRVASKDERGSPGLPRQADLGGLVGFDPFDTELVPRRIFAMGKPAGSSCIAGLFSSVLGAPVVVAADDAEAAAQSSPPNGGIGTEAIGEASSQQSSSASLSPPIRPGERPSRSALGAAFYALYQLARQETASGVAHTSFGHIIRNYLLFNDSASLIEVRESSKLSPLPLQHYQPMRHEEGTHAKHTGMTAPMRRRGDSVTTRTVSTIIEEQGEGEDGLRLSQQFEHLPLVEKYDEHGEVMPRSFGPSTSKRIQGTDQIRTTVQITPPSKDSRISDSTQTGKLQQDEQGRGLVRLGLPDHDFFEIYGAWVREHVRLMSIVERSAG